MDLKQLDAKPIYLDYAATTPVDPRVVHAMLPFLYENFGNPASRSHAYRLARDFMGAENERIRGLRDCLLAGLQAMVGAPISITASTWCRSSCRRCVIGATTYRRWWRISSIDSTRKTAASSRSPVTRWRCSRTAIGRAMCASSRTASSAPPPWPMAT